MSPRDAPVMPCTPGRRAVEHRGVTTASTSRTSRTTSSLPDWPRCRPTPCGGDAMARRAGVSTSSTRSGRSGLGQPDRRPLRPTPCGGAASAGRVVTYSRGDLIRLTVAKADRMKRPAFMEVRSGPLR